MPKHMRSFRHFHLGPTSTQMGCSKHTHLCLHGKQHWSCRTCKHLIFEDIYIKNGLFTTSPITSNVRAFSWSGTTSCLNLHIFAALSLPLSTNVCVKTVGFSFFSTQWYLGLELGKAKGKHSETSNLKPRLERIQSLPSPKILHWPYPHSCLHAKTLKSLSQKGSFASFPVIKHVLNQQLFVHHFQLWH